MKKTYLFIGPQQNTATLEKTGGVIVLFETLLEYCRNHSISYLVIDTNTTNYSNKIFAFFIIITSLLIKIPKVSHVSLHGTVNDYLFIAPVALIITKIFKKKFSLRKFAGNFIEVYENSSWIKRYIIKILLKNSSFNFFETRYLVNYFRKFNKNTFWFPNVRKKNTFIINNHEFRRKFIYLGAISREKGIDLLLDASKSLPREYSIHLYGTIQQDYTIESLNSSIVSYKGELKFKDVLNTLAKYDVLILPSFREGYPGVIIEALAIGLPIIATKLNGISEMLTDKSSILFPKGDTNELVNAILYFNKDNYKKMSHASKKEFSVFDSEYRTKEYLERLDG